MERIVVEKSNITPVIENWQQTVENYKEHALSLSSVRSGAVKPDDAMKWLEVASKLYPDTAVERLLNQVSGFGAKDMRTLIADDRQEYFPTDSANEVYDRKRLKTITPPNGPESEKERILTSIARIVLQQRYGLDRDLDTEGLMAKPSLGGKAEWLVGKPALVGRLGNESLLFDIQFSDSPNEISQADQIRLHYYDLVANNVGRAPHQLNLAKVHISPNMAETLVALAGLSKSAEKSLTDIVKNFESLPRDQFHIEVHQVDKQPEIYKEIIASGQRHWGAVLKNGEPMQHQDPPLVLNDEKRETYIENAKEFIAAAQTVKAAEELRKQSINKFVESMRGYDISDNYSPPHLGALLRKYDHFDAESAASYLEKNMGIDPAHLRKPELNVELLGKAFERMGGDINQFYESGSADKKAIETVAEDIGLDLSAFYTRQMKVIVNPKTRGPIHEAISDIRDSATELIKGVNEQLSQSNLVNAKSLSGASDIPSPKQNTLKV